jgi:YHS domain-containing protein
MILLEILATPGALTRQQRDQLGERLLAELTNHDGMPPDMQTASQALWHVLVSEPHTWVTRGGANTPHERPKYFVRLTVPSGSHPLTHEVRDDYISRISAVLSAPTPHGDVHGQADVVVHIIELPDGSFGTFGRAMTTADVVELITAGRSAAGAAPVETGAHTAVDPVCGMTVDLTAADPVLLAVDGSRWAFCGKACRDVFAARRRAAG